MSFAVTDMHACTCWILVLSANSLLAVVVSHHDCAFQCKFSSLVQSMFSLQTAAVQWHCRAKKSIKTLSTSPNWKQNVTQPVSFFCLKRQISTRASRKPVCHGPTTFRLPPPVQGRLRTIENLQHVLPQQKSANVRGGSVNCFIQPKISPQNGSTLCHHVWQTASQNGCVAAMSKGDS
mgnify:CR=1 FL=1